jgi:hypothetical protein
MKHVTRCITGCLLFVSLLAGPPVLGDSVFTIENPPVDFQVVDAEPFDGVGDNGPFSTFCDVLLGTLGEIRSMAEFDVSSFTVPAGEFISVATLEVRITAIDIYGLGVDGETPGSLAVDGYIGNGTAELSDFQAADGNVLGSIATPDPQIGQVLSFDVTAFVTELVDAQEPFVGLTVRAESFGGLWVGEGGVYPKLTIETGIPGDINHDGRVDLTDLAQLLAHYGMSEGASYEDGDINGDGGVDLTDLALLLAHYGEGA